MTFWRDNAPLDHEEDRSHGTDKQDQAVQSKKADPDDANISAIELERFDNAERRAHVEGHEAGFDIGSSASAPTSAAQAEVSTHRTASAKDKEIFKNRIVWISAFFLLLYVVRP